MTALERIKEIREFHHEHGEKDADILLILQAFEVMRKIANEIIEDGLQSGKINEEFERRMSELENK